MGSEQRWLTALWPTVREQLSPAPATVVEIGCGRLGGFIPRLRASGYDALGIDPVAPEGDAYLQCEFERSELPAQVHAVVACVSLHHVDEPDVVLDRVRSALVPNGTLIVLEWDWESFDEATARWSFARLGHTERDGWLQRHRTRWTATERPWDDYLREWANEHKIHSGTRITSALDKRFRRSMCRRAPYLFPDLADTSETDELDAINRGEIQAMRIDYIGRPLTN